MISRFNFTRKIWVVAITAIQNSSLSQEEKLRQKHFFVFLLGGLPLMVGFGLYNLLMGDTFICILLLVSTVGFAGGWFAQLVSTNCRRIYRFKATVFSLLLIYVVTVGGIDGSMPLWLFTFPPIVLFILGKSEGLVWALCLLPTVFLSSLLSLPYIEQYQYSKSYLTRFVIVYLILCALSYWFEYFRSSYRKKLLEEHRRFQEILKYSRDILYRKDVHTGRYQYISKAFCAHLGYEESELQFFLSKNVKSIIHPDDRHLHSQRIPLMQRNSSDDERGTSVQLRMRHKSGKYLWFSDQFTVLYNDENEPEAIIGSNREITRQRQTEIALQQAKDQLHTIFDSIDAHIYVADMETYRILFMNSKMKEDFGHDKEDKICFQEFRQEKQPCSNCTNGRLLQENNQPTGVCEWKGYNQITGKWYNNYDRAIQWTDGRWVRLQIAVDITRQTYLEEEQKRTEDIVRRARHMEAIGTLAGGIAHDFNNILQVVLGNISLAESREISQEQRSEYLQNSKNAAEKARDLASQIVTLSSVRSVSKISINLTPFLEQISAELTIDTQITRILQIESDLWRTCIDYNQIDKVIRNIITNSCESITGKGRLKIIAENYSHQPAKNVVRNKFAAIKDGRYVKISFEDNGRGIDRADFNKVFEPYYSTKQRGSGKGVGLGLAIAHSILDQHHGHIYIESQKKHGTRVVFFLPVPST